jgi:hypothetical protein
LTEDYGAVIGGFIMKGNKLYVNSVDEVTLNDCLKPIVQRECVTIVGSFAKTITDGWNTETLIDAHTAFIAGKDFQR